MTVYIYSDCGVEVGSLGWQLKRRDFKAIVNWKKTNDRRAKLIDKKLNGQLTERQVKELVRLNRLARILIEQNNREIQNAMNDLESKISGAKKNLKNIRLAKKKK